LHGRGGKAREQGPRSTPGKRVKRQGTRRGGGKEWTEVPGGKKRWLPSGEAGGSSAPGGGLRLTLPCLPREPQE